MNVEYTGRHYEVTPANRKDIEAGLTKIRKILRDKFDTKVILSIEKHRHKAEITIHSSVGPLVGLAQSAHMSAAIGEALEHLEKQALKGKTWNYPALAGNVLLVRNAEEAACYELESLGNGDG